MKSISRSLLGVALACLFIAITGCKTGHRANFEPGSQAPDFTFTDPIGSEKHLSDFKGEVVLLVLWASWCDTCKSELSALNHLQLALKDRGLKVVAPVVNDVKENFLSFIASNPQNYMVGFANEDVASLYQITGVPEIFVLDREGKFVLLQDLPSGDATMRFLGPRAWDSPEMIAQFERILNK